MQLINRLLLENSKSKTAGQTDKFNKNVKKHTPYKRKLAGYLIYPLIVIARTARNFALRLLQLLRLNLNTWQTTLREVQTNVGRVGECFTHKFIYPSKQSDPVTQTVTKHQMSTRLLTNHLVDQTQTVFCVFYQNFAH